MSVEPVAVLGVGMHPWGKWGRNFVEYGVAAARDALTDAGVDWRDVGFVAGAYTDARDRTLLVVISVMAGSSAALIFVTAALESILGSPRVAWDQLAGVTVAGVLYSVLLAPVLLAVLSWAARRLTPEAVG